MVINLFNVLEQFEILPLLSLRLTKFSDISITNTTFLLFLVIAVTYFFALTLYKSNTDKTFYLVPSRYQTFLELIYKMIAGMVLTNVGNDEGKKFFPLFFTVFLFLFILNLVGTVPYSFAVTSHIIVTFTFAFIIYFGFKIIGIIMHGFKLGSLLLPGGTSGVLCFILVPIELISIVFKPVSLAVRLFANIMSGHILLKVIAGFVFTLTNFTGALFVLSFFPLFLLFPLILLEMVVAMIQTYVFCILITIYLGEVITLH